MSEITKRKLNKTASLNLPLDTEIQGEVFIAFIKAHK
jgi:hypothetical protein